MKTSKHFTLILTGIIALTAIHLSAEAMEISPEATEAVRVVAAKEKLTADSDTLVVFAKGLCCPSCAIGVRKMISRLDFVDRKRFNKGVDLDTKVQLITVAVGEDKKPDYKSLSEAIFDAGYDPVRTYSLKDGDLLTEPLAADS